MLSITRLMLVLLAVVTSQSKSSRSCLENNMEKFKNSHSTSSPVNVRKRKKYGASPTDESKIIRKPSIAKQEGLSSSGFSNVVHLCWHLSCRSCGFLVLIFICWRYATYVNELHENNLWFSQIKQVEREISFRTESGLYYSYFKQLVSASSLTGGVRDLTRDNTTEHPSTINVLARMNIYQEVVLAAIYRILPASLQNLIEPIYLYIYSVFALHGLLVGSLYMISWCVSGTWLAGLLTALFYIFNRVDVTRVEMWTPLRENFSLPFLWAQLFVLTVYFRQSTSGLTERFCRNALVVFTFLFAVTWQFNQFAFLLQTMALFGLQVLRLVEHRKVEALYAVGAVVVEWREENGAFSKLTLLQDTILFVYYCQAVGMGAVYILQFFNPMIAAGVLASFLTSAVVVMWLQSRRSVNYHPSIILGLCEIVGYTGLVFLLTFMLNAVVKFFIKVDADEHIYKFVLTKFGFSEPSRDFDVRLYLCNGAFEFLDKATIIRLAHTWVFPVYCCAHIVLLVLLSLTVFHRWRRAVVVENDTFQLKPELAYHAVQATFFGCVGLMILRMKYFWTPYMCIISSVALANRKLWELLLSWRRCQSDLMVEFFRRCVVVATAAGLLYTCLPSALNELKELREFYDPDTVSLMEWISSNTTPSSSFTGSMQLLAGVKLCTGRPITNHPHYEDKSLRKRTRELYKMYGRYSLQEVFDTMNKYAVDYMILEDSICLAPSKNGCRLPDLLDIDSGIVPDNVPNAPGLVKSGIPRFCVIVRNSDTDYAKYFPLVFENRTFRVYRVLRRKKA